ncbi:MAG TPA: hypothetical protein VNQ73_15630 [Ilumatobacter sp.]|nr:hypothetical protein [Ilumatobacter sp.]
MRSWTRSRALAGLGIAAIAVFAAPAPVLADPPGPTDFESTIVAVEPAVDGVAASIVGGDAFFVLDVDPGIVVTVAGYQGEPYLEFDATGEVRENRQSPTYFASRTKAGAKVPDDVTASTPPSWTVVAHDGTYAWHDHRTHWMGGQPTGNRGDVVARGQVALVVDGEPVTVRVETRWLPAASPLPAAAGLLVGVLAAAGYVLARRRGLIAADLVLGAAAVLALGVGLVQYRSVPALTDPSPFGWLLPATALVAAVAAAALDRRAALAALGARLLAGAELVIWGVTRRSGLLAAILPTDAPFWLDRSATVAVAVVGLATVALAAAHLIDLVTRPAVS